jgi:hypothetical protein
VPKVVIARRAGDPHGLGHQFVQLGGVQPLIQGQARQDAPPHIEIGFGDEAAQGEMLVSLAQVADRLVLGQALRRRVSEPAR